MRILTPEALVRASTEKRIDGRTDFLQLHLDCWNAYRNRRGDLKMRVSSLS